MLSSLGCQRNTANQHVFKLFSYHANKHFVGFPILITGQYRITILYLCWFAAGKRGRYLVSRTLHQMFLCSWRGGMCPCAVPLSHVLQGKYTIMSTNLQIHTFCWLTIHILNSSRILQLRTSCVSYCFEMFCVFFWLLNVIRSKLDVVFFHGTYVMLF